MAVQQKPSSRWAFLSNAVASVESGLDKILAEEDESTTKSQPKPAKPQANGSNPRPSTDVKRSDSSGLQNDRLQARLAQAMARKNASRATTPAPDVDSSRPGTPSVGQVHSSQPAPDEAEDVVSEEDGREVAKETQSISEAISIPTVDVVPASQGEETGRPSTTTSRDSTEGDRRSATMSLEPPRPSGVSSRASDEQPSRTSVPNTDSVLLNVQIEHENSIDSLQEEINAYLERIDALQRNMQILAKETIANAKMVKSDVQSSSIEKQLADKDERIALLMEEGTKLTKSELQYRKTIKALRTQAITLNKDQDAARGRAEKAERSLSALETRASEAEARARQKSEELATVSRSATDLAAVTKERNALQSTLAEVRSQLGKANKRAEQAEVNAQSDKLETERKRTAELQDDLTSSKVEHELATDKSKREIEELKRSLQAERAQARQMENDMLAEQAALESKLEGFRLRAEEATSGNQGDTQAKLLRQIETLQNQYSTASQNWRGIESTLLARITALEKDKDEVTGREADLKRKLRDATSKARAVAKELEDVQLSLNSLQDQQTDQDAEIQRANKQVTQLKDELSLLRKEHEEQKQRVEREIVRRLEDEKARWVNPMQRVDSSIVPIRKGPIGSFVDGLMSPGERPSSRRSSTQPFYDHNFASPRVNSAVSIKTNGAMPETPSIALHEDQDDFFASIPPTPARTHAESPSRTLNDLMSASVAGAGPSVQLVERLSTNVRRLESEKAASKDEVARLSSQRDEARQEVVNLMREVEQTHSVSQQLVKVEKEHNELQQKYQAMLELLGEKTEQVEELKADIADVKQMYRQLADTMGR
ncbi:hypothetical protein LTS08_006467 [Lithohypha guttulata]|uniref:TATA element modulatory factor 1 TATA binding domain-containing protein n=1 Tax=Lithohypha guttulata TaxID=1690604 RepID=A0AAN7T1U1_9EURO|nr:hypothetical protein LTR05_005234 [Lithohypha guttulata]KAK5098334.1 hypothetical protein LTS08_006467 [Lithohypha guttulata]